MVLSMTFISAYADNEFSMSANNIEFSTSQIYVDGPGIELPYLQYEIVNPITNTSASDSVSIENVTSIKATLIPESKERALSLLNPNTSNNIVSELCDVFEGMVSPQNESWITIPAVDGFIWYYSTINYLRYYENGVLFLDLVWFEISQNIESMAPFWKEPDVEAKMIQVGSDGEPSGWETFDFTGYYYNPPFNTKLYVPGYSIDEDGNSWSGREWMPVHPYDNPIIGLSYAFDIYYTDNYPNPAWVGYIQHEVT